MIYYMLIMTFNLDSWEEMAAVWGLLLVYETNDIKNERGVNEEEGRWPVGGVTLVV